MNLFTGQRPDIPVSVVGSVVFWAASQAAAYGWLDNLPTQATLSGVSTFIASAWVLGDMYLRGKRNIARSIEASAASPVASTRVNV